ncbi:sensor histidine kinase [Nonomuraea maritima]|uniref:sensor histidine kinase n=1 Tax=Nonomuraea maritima TaxID=683260 RepID=UPI00371C53A0
MSRADRWVVAAAWGGVVVAAALTVAALTLGMRTTALLGTGYDDLYLADIWAGLLFPAAGAWLLSPYRVRRERGRRVGLLLTATGLLALGGFCGHLATLLVVTGGHEGVAAWVATWAWVPYLFLTTLLPQLWPTGRVTHRLLTPVTAAVLAAVAVGAAVTPGPLEGFPRITNPLGGSSWADDVTGLLIGAVVMLLAPLSVVATWLRLRREPAGSDARRRQGPLVVACAVAVPALLVQDSLAYPLSDIWTALALTGVAVAVVAPTALADRRAAAGRERARLALLLWAERERIHRDLHDELGPELAGMALQVAAEADRVPDAEARRSLDALAGRMRLSVGEVRRIVERVRPAALGDGGLPAALERRAAQLSAGPTRVELVHSGVDALPPHLEETLYRVVSEAMTNAVRHARAARCTVSVTRGGGEVIAEIADDGRGVSGDRTGTGIPGMRDRVAGAGGALAIGPGPSGGTVVSVRIPLEECA